MNVIPYAYPLIIACLATIACDDSTQSTTRCSTEDGGDAATGGSKPTGAGGKTSTGGISSATGGASVATGGTISYIPCHCDQSLAGQSGAAGAPTNTAGAAGATKSVTMPRFEAWSTSDQRDLVQGIISIWIYPFYPYEKYIGPAIPSSEFTVFIVGQANRSIKVIGISCGEAENIEGNNQHLILYLTDGSRLEGSISNTTDLFVQSETTTINVLQPAGLTGSVNPRVCFRQIPGNPS